MMRTHSCKKNNTFQFFRRGNNKNECTGKITVVHNKITTSKKVFSRCSRRTLSSSVRRTQPSRFMKAAHIFCTSPKRTEATRPVYLLDHWSRWVSNAQTSIPHPVASPFCRKTRSFKGRECTAVLSGVYNSLSYCKLTKRENYRIHPLVY
jgi:hypothetical protein